MIGMKKLLLLGSLIGINGLVYGTTIVSTTTDTFAYSGADALAGGSAYAWCIGIAVPSGESIVSANVVFTGIELTASGLSSGTGVVYTDLLNLGGTANAVTTINEGDTTYDYWTTKYTGANITAVSSNGFTLYQTKSWTNSLTSSELASLSSYLAANNGTFTIGIDPNCHYSVGSITFNYTLGSSSVPDGTTTALLLLAGLAGVELFRRQVVMAKAKAKS
jgi:hypothetical protein